MVENRVVYLVGPIDSNPPFELDESRLKYVSRHFSLPRAEAAKLNGEKRLGIIFGIWVEGKINEGRYL